MAMPTTDQNPRPDDWFKSMINPFPQPNPVQQPQPQQQQQKKGK